LETEIRKKAIQRYLNGEKPKVIYTDLNHSKKWFFKWLKRYQTGKANWYKNESRAPHNRPKRTSEIDRERVIKTRKRLGLEHFAQIGASAIKWELHKSGFTFPSDRTINRILKEEGMVKKKFLHL
jgi:putative transposase